jgi:hypothetical protein
MNSLELQHNPIFEIYFFTFKLFFMGDFILFYTLILKINLNK